ncbi:MAG: HisA/HisF-related TIM barrel protein [Solirubrobacterales bacterium]
MAVDGWQEVTGGEPEAVIESLMARGVRSFVYSNVERDGMLEGPDLDEVSRIAGIEETPADDAGGIGSLADLEALAALRQVNLGGVIVGKALYERRFTVREGQEALRR